MWNDKHVWSVPWTALEWPERLSRQRNALLVRTGEVTAQVRGIVFWNAHLFERDFLEKTHLSFWSPLGLLLPLTAFPYVPASLCSCLVKYLQIMRLMHLDSWKRKNLSTESPCGSQTLFITTPLMGPEAHLKACLKNTRFFRCFFFSFLLKNVSLIASPFCL